MSRPRTRNSTVARPRYGTAAIRAVAAACSRARTSSSSQGAGAISTSFWRRRCTEQSRSPRASTVPAASAATCTSMCLAPSMSSSAYRAAEPKAARASAAHRSYAAARPAALPDRGHAPPAAAGDRLDHDGAARSQAVKEAPDLVERGRAAGAAGNRDAESRRDGARPALVAERLKSLRRRADESHLPFGTLASEVRVLGEKAVAGMDRVRARRHRRGDDGVDVQVARRAGPRQRDGLVGAGDVRAVAVVGGVDGDGATGPRGRRRR